MNDLLSWLGSQRQVVPAPEGGSWSRTLALPRLPDGHPLDRWLSP